MGRYHEISGSGEDWVPRYYSTMITEFFQEGFTDADWDAWPHGRRMGCFASTC